MKLPFLRFRSRRPGFTLLEVLIAMGVGSMLILVIYFFFSGIYRTGSKSESRLELNQHAEIQLERLVRELQLAVEMKELRPDRISFKRPQILRWGKTSGYEVNMDLSTHKFQTVTYRRKELEGGKRVALQRILGMERPDTLFIVDELDKKIFTGWVIPRGAEETPHEVPEMEIYNPARDVRSDLERIPLIRIRFKMKIGLDRIDILTKAFVPPVYAKIVQPNWNKS
jgi:prepilin-type N-terminal cleavage/methylation domain-containing protein